MSHQLASSWISFHHFDKRRKEQPSCIEASTQENSSKNPPTNPQKQRGLSWTDEGLVLSNKTYFCISKTIFLKNLVTKQFHFFTTRYLSLFFFSLHCISLHLILIMDYQQSRIKARREVIWRRKITTCVKDMPWKSPLTCPFEALFGHLW